MNNQPTTSTTPSPPRRMSDRGSTFIELLVSVVLLGTAGIAVLVGMGAAIRGSNTHDRLATVQTSLSDAGDHLTDVTLGNDTYVSCASTTDYDSEVSAWQVTVTEIHFWDGTDWVGSCSGDEMQRIKLRASIDGLDRQLVVVKRPATVALTPGGAWDDEIVIPQKHPDL